MIPVLGVPVLTQYHLLRGMLTSIDVPVARVVVIDNGGGLAPIAGTEIVRMPSNIGVAASWNLIIKSTPDAPWWAIVNHDVAFAPGDLQRLTLAMDGGAPLVTLAGFAAFGISRECVQTVGYFDENYHPAYCEDADYEYRCRLKGVPVVAEPSNLEHESSATIKEPDLRRENSRTYEGNRAYFFAKWGVAVREGQGFTTPFDSGADPSQSTPDHKRLVAQRWPWREPEETTALEPSYELRVVMDR